jgi:hypothetical protein
MKVETYTMLAGNGRKVRKATMVTLTSGRVIRFTERMPKRDAIRQATELVHREAVRAAWQPGDVPAY